MFFETGEHLINVKHVIRVTWGDDDTCRICTSYAGEDNENIVCVSKDEGGRLMRLLISKGMIWDAEADSENPLDEAMDDND